MENGTQEAMEKVLEGLSHLIARCTPQDMSETETLSRATQAELCRILVDNIPQRIFWKDLNFEYVWANRQFAIDSNVRCPEELIGKHDFELPWTKEQAQSYRKDDMSVLHTRQPRLNIIEPQTRADGSFAWLSTNKIPLYDKDNNLVGVIGTYEDITERTQAEIMLRRYHQMIESIFSTIPVAIFWKDRNSVYLGCNANFAEDAGFAAPEELVGKTDFDLPWTDEQSLMFREDDKWVIEKEMAKHNFIEKQRQAQGNTAWLQVNKVPLRDNDNNVIGVLGTYQDITEQIEASEALRRVRLNALEERQRLARDLHDAVSQTLWTASIIADVLPTTWDQDRNEGERNLQQLRRLVHGALAEMRTLLLELRPHSLLETEISDLLNQLARATMSHKKLDIKVSVDKTCPLPSDVKLVAYRITQEAINNIARHARATDVTIDLTCEPHEMVLKVCDNGQGFDTTKLPANRMGISIMRERATNTRGRLTIESEPGKGTVLAFVWPRISVSQDGDYE